MAVPTPKDLTGTITIRSHFVVLGKGIALLQGQGSDRKRTGRGIDRNEREQHRGHALVTGGIMPVRNRPCLRRDLAAHSRRVLDWGTE